ncbi:MAG: amidohydrolase [Clostridiales bacterium]|nr:amidohydrolase [Candidatus Crickella merdequi]
MAILFDSIKNEIIKEITDIRRSIHMNPELGNWEFETADLIERYLNSIGIPTRRYLDTAVVGIIEFDKPGKRIAFRADIDALPVEESTGVDYASQVKGVMHACGHDVHTAALLGAARLLIDVKDQLSGSAVLIFQPDEEGDGGAKRLIAEGVLDGVEAIYGAHVAPDLPEGTVGIRYDKFYAAADMFDVTVRGRASHGAQPEKGIDALAAAAEAVVRIKGLPEGEKDKCVVSTGMFKAGTVRNQIADTAEFSGIIRSLGADNRENLRRRLIKSVNDACDKYGATAAFNFKESYMGIVNTHNEVITAETAALTEFGRNSVVIIEGPLMTTEDFGFYIDECGGCFYHIGAGCEMPLHSPEFIPTEGALITAMRMHAAVAVEKLK